MKLCNRDYSGNHMFTVKQIKGIACCPNCEKPAGLHGATVEQRAIAWAVSDDTGSSSKMLCRHMSGNLHNSAGYYSAPSDSGDRGRCIRLLELIPEWIDRLPEMAQFYNKPQEGIVINSSGLSVQQNGWAGQIALIIKEGKF